MAERNEHEKGDLRVEHPAHIRIGESGDIVQSVREHSVETALIAERDLAGIGLGKTAYITGLLHDPGKCKKEFAEHLYDAVHGGPAKDKKVNHSFAGARLVLERRPKNGKYLELLPYELIAYAIRAHHGLFDCVDDKRKNGFVRIRDAEVTDCKKSIEAFLRECPESADIDCLLEQAVREITDFCSPILKRGSGDIEEKHFHIGLVARLLLSAVINGDRADTAKFMIDRITPDDAIGTPDMWRECIARLDERLSGFKNDSAIGSARGEISRLCFEAAAKPAGIYTLNVPTGGGKTLSSLRFALAHAEKHGMKRIFYVAPLISIIEQNAKEIREAIGSGARVLEHHSNVVREKSNGETDISELSTEDWSCPVIITTLVQLLDSIFASRTGAIRRFRALAESVIVFDEVQSLPANCLTLFNMAIGFLAESCKSTVILCSATQPTFEKAAHPPRVPIKELIELPREFAPIFRRTKIIDIGSMTLDELAEHLEARAKNEGSLLVICNKRSQAAYLFEKMKDSAKIVRHLSATMCPKHRSDILDEVKSGLLASENVILISTQVVEAGVDISFRAVTRILAGMDSASQAAGRCNRNGEFDGLCVVELVRIDKENLNNLESIKLAREASEELTEEYRNAPERFENDLVSDTSIKRYYECWFSKIKKLQDYPLGGDDDKTPNKSAKKPMKNTTMYDLLSINATFADEHSEEIDLWFMRQAFGLAASNFKVIEDDTMGVIVPYGEGAELIADLLSERAKHDGKFLYDTLTRAKPYTIALYRGRFEQLAKDGAFYEIGDTGAFVLTGDFYDKMIGLSVKPKFGAAIQ